METLYLVIAKKWFDMILSGEKPEEYRDVTKYYLSRLGGCKCRNKGKCTKYCPYFRGYQMVDACSNFFIRQYKELVIINGYSKHARRATFQLDTIELGYGKPEWGAIPCTRYFAIKIGERNNEFTRKK